MKKRTRDEFNKYFYTLTEGNIDRFGIVFQTKYSKFFYDTGTGKVLRCSDDVYTLLLHLFENNGVVTDGLEMGDEEFDIAVSKLQEAIEKERIFQAVKMESFNTLHMRRLDNEVGVKCDQLILELTEKCNLRCRYCIYGDEMARYRSFGMKDMTFDVAKKAMDYIMPIADQEMMYLTFYGGEPLLNFTLLQQSVEYFKENYSGEKLGFGLTTNLTLMTEEMAHFFAENQFQITGSLDGNEEIHDKNRIYCHGKGSFQDAIKGLKLLVEAYGEASDKISINMVVDRPYDTEKFDAIQTFYDQLAWLPRDVRIRTNYVDRDLQNEDIDNERNIDLIKNMHDFENVFESWVFDKMRKSKETPIFSDSSLRSGLLDIHQRILSENPITELRFNACCIPGGRRLYVTTEGEFKLCERVGTAPSIGNVDKGIDIDAVRKYYVDDYQKKSMKNCSNCWAAHLCGVCYAGCFDENGLDMKRKKVACAGVRYTILNSFIMYYTLLEEQPDILAELNDVEFE